MAAYARMTVAQLKVELLKRSAITAGRKADLIDRLESYDRNDNFQGPAIILPEQVLIEWPIEGFRQLTPEHKTNLPKLCSSHIETYFEHRLATDKQAVGDSKALQKGQALLHSDRVDACSLLLKDNQVYYTGIVKAAMKKKVSYNYKLSTMADTAEIVNTHCECPAGKGPHGTCKHLASVLLMLCHFMVEGVLLVSKSCTEISQTFHKPSHPHIGSPVKAQALGDVYGRKRSLFDDDPRPAKYRNNPGYGDWVRNKVLNMCSISSMDVTMRFLYEKADMKAAVMDHDYLQLPFTEYCVDKAIMVSAQDIQKLENNTRNQAKCKQWYDERSWRLTASNFGSICKATERRDKDKLCKTLLYPINLMVPPVIHGRMYEQIATRTFEDQEGLNVQKCGLFVSLKNPFLAATPDGIIDADSIIEVKCPFKGKDEVIQPGTSFPFLYSNSDGQILLKENSNYYFQVQGQLYICEKKLCYFVVYSHKDLFVQKIYFDLQYCENSLVPKLTLFWEKYFRPYVSKNALIN